MKYFPLLALLVVGCGSVEAGTAADGAAPELGPEQVLEGGASPETKPALASDAGAAEAPEAHPAAADAGDGGAVAERPSYVVSPCSPGYAPPGPDVHVERCSSGCKTGGTPWGTCRFDQQSGALEIDVGCDLNGVFCVADCSASCP